MEAGTNRYGTGLIRLIRDRSCYLEGEIYVATEVPKGELGFYLISDGSPKPCRYRVRPPSFINLTILEDMCLGHYVADAVIILGSVDIVMGEVDR
jgi:NADH-quinone oxidoreductase subunit D